MGRFLKLKDLTAGTPELIEFQSQLSLDEAVSRLAAIVETRWFWLGTRNRVLGEVSRDRVRLRFWRGWSRNWGTPQFVGQFVQRQDAVYLTGSFSWPFQMRSQVIALGTMGALMVILGIVSLIDWEPARPFPSAPFVGLAGVLVGFAFTWMYRDVRGSSDTAALEMAIRNALAKDRPAGAAT